MPALDPSQSTFRFNCLDAPVAVTADREARRPRLAGALLRTQPDERLAQLAGEGSEQAFEELVRRHRANLVTFAGSIAPPGYADDVVQDSMVKAQAALLRGDEPEYAKAWLYKIVRNTALNERRGWRDHDEIDETIDGVEQPPQAFERRADIRNLVIALNDLPEAQRDALVQREMEGRGHDEIASALQVSPGAVRQLIHRARTTLRASAGAVVPAFLLRAAVLGGGSEQAIGGAAAAGIGISGAKLGVGALLATGAIVTGVGVGTEIRDKGKDDSPAAAQSSAAATSEPASSSASATGNTGRVAAHKASLKSAGAFQPKQRDDRPPPEQFGQHHPGDGETQVGTQPPPPEDTTDTAQKPPPPGGGHAGTGGGKLPPPPPPPE
jgi:RNA polymerase sigma factor (sigma-70 family)